MESATVFQWVAYHEAGHAVAAHVLDRRIKSVSIRPRYDVKQPRLKRRDLLSRIDACFAAPSSVGRANIDYKPGKKESSLEDLEKSVAISLAGIIAERKLFGGFDLQGGSNDFKFVEQLKDAILSVYTARYPLTTGYGNNDLEYWHNETSDQASERCDTCLARTAHFVEETWQRTSDLFEDPKNWHAVEALAEMLLTNPERTMNGLRASKIVREALLHHKMSALKSAI